ncbi:MAG: TraR/DksA family transcriptional regulator [Acidimicrobiales bacterium]
MASDAPSVDLRALLDREREVLRTQLAELGFGTVGGPTYDPNFADSSQVTAERGEAEALAANLRDALDEVEKALTKLEDGSYGICEGCQQPINPARLEAKPEALLCISCASKR